MESITSIFFTPVFVAPIAPRRGLAVCGVLWLCQFLDVTFVLGTRRRFLVPDEVVETNEGHLHATIGASNDVGACLLIGDTVDLVDSGHDHVLNAVLFE